MRRLSKADARRALVNYHFGARTTLDGAFEKLRSVQFDPIAPIGCNHDLVLQARVEGYRIGGWEEIAYGRRLVYDGWDKQASLVPFTGWAVRRVFWHWHRRWHEQMIADHPHSVAAILSELRERGPLLPREFHYQEKREDWKGTWYGPNVVKQSLRALWHAGQIMTAGRRGGHHVYDLTERVVPRELREMPLLTEQDAATELVRDRHQAMGLVRPNAGPEIWSNAIMGDLRKKAITDLVARGEIVPVEVEGMRLHASPDLLAALDQSAPAEVTFVAPLDPFLWDRKMTAHVFNFEYIWEIYTPEAKRRWGYYVLPVRFGDELVARIEFHARAGVLEVRAWHLEQEVPGFWEAFAAAAARLRDYAGVREVRGEGISEPVLHHL